MNKIDQQTAVESEAPRLRTLLPVGETDILTLLDALWQGKWRIARAMVVMVVLGAIYLKFIAVPIYGSTTAVVLESRDAQIVDFDSVVSGLSGDIATINTEVDVLQSRRLLGKVVDKLNLMEDPEFNFEIEDTEPSWFRENVIALMPDLPSISELLPVIESGSGPPPKTQREIRDAVIKNVLAAVSIRNDTWNRVFHITVLTTDPFKSARIADTLAELYVQDQLQVKFEATEQATGWLTERVAILKSELEEAESAVKAFNKRADVVSPESLELLNRQLKDLRERRVGLQDVGAAAAVRARGLREAMGREDLVEVARLSRDPMLERLAVIAPTDAEARAQFDARAEQALVRAEFEEQRTGEQIATVEASIAELESRIDRQSADLVRLQQLEREAEASRAIYEYFLTRLKETAVQLGIQQADSRILSDAVINRLPAKPRKGLTLALCAMVGFFIGSGLVIARKMRQSGFRQASEIEDAVGVTVIGQIPRTPSVRSGRLIQQFATRPSSAIAEAVRDMRTSILLSNVDRAPQTILLTSTVPEEGKTTLSLMLTVNLAQMGKKVLLVEGDIRRRAIWRYLGLEEGPGLVSAVTGERPLSETVRYSELLGADVLLGEKSHINAADFFASARFTALIDEARAHYDIVLIDTPPVLVVPDARVIGQAVDAIFYVVRWDSTPRASVAQGLHSLRTVNINVRGIVLNQIDRKGMKRYGYGDVYGRSYGRYARGYYDR